MEKEISNELSILGYIHCGKCLEEFPENESPQSYASFEVGFTKEGLQIWCKRHKCND